MRSLASSGADWPGQNQFPRCGADRLLLQMNMLFQDRGSSVVMSIVLTNGDIGNYQVSPSSKLCSLT